jgi:hypothetical protein
MATARESWFWQEAMVSIRKESDNSVVCECKYAQNVSLKAIRQDMPYQQPGEATTTERSVVVGYEVKIGMIFGNRATELVALTNGTRLRVSLPFACNANGSEPLVARDCEVTDGPEVIGQDNESWRASVGLKGRTLDAA